ncbi:MAG: hypothetical protein ABEH43_03715, partial [Flavobacteriales bacterium]
YTSGSYESENSYELFDSDSTLLFEDGKNGTEPSTGNVFSGTANCCKSSFSCEGGTIELTADGTGKTVDKLDNQFDES